MPTNKIHICWRNPNKQPRMPYVIHYPDGFIAVYIGAESVERVAFNLHKLSKGGSVNKQVSV